MSYNQSEKQFFLQKQHCYFVIVIVILLQTKANHQLSETFYFIKLSYFDSYEAFSTLSDVFCQKKFHFLLKQLRYLTLIGIQ